MRLCPSTVVITIRRHFTVVIRMGSVVLSVDSELGWGHHDLEHVPSERVSAGRDGWERLADLLSRFEVPATWAVVGHLLLEDCDGVHSDHPAPDGWFARERTVWRSRPDLRFAPELVEKLQDAPVDHEIACHTFSHVEFDERTTGRSLARAELSASLDAAAASDIPLKSFVFPRNIVGYRDLLVEYGFRCYRGRSLADERDSRVGQSVLRLLRSTRFGEDLLVVEPTVDEYGLVNVPASMFLFSFEGTTQTVAAAVGEDPIVSQAKRGIDLAAGTDGIFHMWLHPNNIHSEYAIERLRSILAYMSGRRDDSELSVETMRDVAERIRRDHRPEDRRRWSRSDGVVK